MDLNSSALVGQISMHNPQRVHISFGSMKSSLRFSPIGVGGDKNKFSGHTSTQSLHLMHKILSTTISFKESHYNLTVAYHLFTSRLNFSKNKCNFIPTRCKFFLNVKIF